MVRDSKGFAREGSDAEQPAPAPISPALLQEIREWVDDPSWYSLGRQKDIEQCEAWLTEDPRDFGDIKYLGGGAFGVVFQAHQSGAKSPLAYKVLRPSLGYTEMLRKRLVREAKAVASLDHPGIVRLVESGLIGPQPFLATELVVGPDLARFLGDLKQPLLPDQAAELVMQVAESVQYAHTRGVLHRDIKPSNILLEPRDSNRRNGLEFAPRLTDFGLAKFIDQPIENPDSLSAGFRVMGTVRYMSPEQATGKTQDVGIGSDVFSLGVILYEITVGRLPFDGDSDPRILQQIANEDPIRPRKLRPYLPKDFEAIILKCLEKAPENRYASAGELASDLRRFLDREPVKATIATPIAKLRYWSRKNPNEVILVSVLVASFIVASAMVGFALLNERHHRLRASFALNAIEKIFFATAEKLNEGRVITHEDNIPLLLACVKLNEELSDQENQSTASVHRLSVAHHFAANGFARINRLDEAFRHRLQVLKLLDELLTREPTNEKYTYQQFVANFNLANELDPSDIANGKKTRITYLESAGAIINSLMLKAPDNPIYVDASNALDLTLATKFGAFETWSESLLNKAIASSKLLWEKNRDQPQLAKHAIAGSATLASLKNSLQNYQESILICTNAMELLDLALSDHRKDAWVEMLELRLHEEQCDALLGLESWMEAIQFAKRADALIVLLQEGYVSPKAMAERSIQSLKNQALAYRHLDREVDAIECEETVVRLSKEFMQNTP